MRGGVYHWKQRASGRQTFQGDILQVSAEIMIVLANTVVNFKLFKINECLDD